MSLKRIAELCAQEFTVTYEGGEAETLWIRTRSQAEIEDAANAAAEARLLIRERYAEGTPAYRSLIATMEMETEERLVSAVLMSEWAETAVAARRDVPQLIPPDLSVARTAAQREKMEADHEKRVAEHNRMMDEAIRKRLNDREAKLRELSKADLVQMALRPQLAAQIEAETGAVFESYAILESVRLADDHGKRYFDSIEEIEILPLQVRVMLLTAIKQVDDIRPCDIKNSQGTSVLLSGRAESIPAPGEAPSTPN